MSETEGANDLNSIGVTKLICLTDSGNSASEFETNCKKKKHQICYSHEFTNSDFIGWFVLYNKANLNHIICARRFTSIIFVIFVIFVYQTDERVAGVITHSSNRHVRSDYFHYVVYYILNIRPIFAQK
jgi:hypothetical protein